MVAIAPLLILSNNYERNFAVLLEKLPWRKSAAAILKAAREDQMLASASDNMASLPLSTKSRVALVDAGRSVGDIDIAVWARDRPEIMIISLKWSNGPDSVREVRNHSERHRWANDQQKKVLSYCEGHKAEVARRWGISAADPEALTFLPVIVHQAYLPLELDRVRELPATTLARFNTIIRRRGGNLAGAYARIHLEDSSYPDIEVAVDHVERRVGEIRFRLPSSIVQP
jgi:hypothetical protein